MDVEKSLISAIRTKEEFLRVLDEKITPEFFETQSEVFKVLLSHYKHYGDIPSKEALLEYVPNFSFTEIDQPIMFYVDRLKFLRKKNILKTTLAEAIGLVSKDPDAAETIMQKGVHQSKMEIKVATDLDVRENIALRKSDYFIKKESLGVDGYSTSWDMLDDKTAGLHPGDLVVTIAEMKGMKSWLLVWQARHIWLEERVPVLYLTREMRPEAIRLRFDAINCKLPYDDLRRGLLTPPLEEKYFQYLEEIEKDEVPFIVLGYSLESSGASVSSIVPKVERHLMDGGLLCVDGIYLMEDDRGGKDWQQVVNITRDLKNLGQQYSIPILATSQAQVQGKGYRPDYNNIAYAKYMGQYVDAMCSISRSQEERDAGIAKINLILQREGDLCDFTINAQFSPYCDFSQKHVETVYDDDEPMKF